MLMLPEFTGCHFVKKEGEWFQVIGPICLPFKDEYAIDRLERLDFRPDRYKVTIYNLGGMSRGNPCVVYEDKGGIYDANRSLHAYKDLTKAYKKARELNVKWRQATYDRDP